MVSDSEHPNSSDIGAVIIFGFSKSFSNPQTRFKNNISSGNPFCAKSKSQTNARSIFDLPSAWLYKPHRKPDNVLWLW